VEVYEKINYLITEKKMTKQDFIKKLIAIEPKLKRTGEVPSPSTINGYLYGQREIKIELIPYIAEVLGVSEQELFSFDLEYSCNNNYRQSKEVRELIHNLQYAPNTVIQNFKEQLAKYKALHDESLRKF
jgi:transcriptional regulator with XRE-family HTH domain